MKASELRIGNYVYGLSSDHKTKNIDIIASISQFGWETVSGIQGIESIPLTKEWLLKFGFELIDHSGTHFLSKDIEINNGNHPDLYLHFHIKDAEIVSSGITSGEIDNEDVYEGERIHLENVIAYVHQLQNLYFALTGEELKIKES